MLRPRKEISGSFSDYLSLILDRTLDEISVLNSENLPEISLSNKKKSLSVIGALVKVRLIFNKLG